MIYFCYILKKYLHSFIQFAVFTGCVARQTNRLYVLRMIVKLSGEAREAAYILPQSPERVVLLAVRVPNFDVDSFGLSFRPSTVVRYYMKYIGLSLAPVPQVLLIDRGASRVENEQKLWVLVRFQFEEVRSVKRWVTFYLDLHYIMHTIY